MAAINTYPPDTEISLAVLFTALGVPVDPALATLYIMSPGGIEQMFTYPGSLQRNGVGNYSYLFLPDGPGTWIYTWEGSGNMNVASFDQPFNVKPSVNILPPYP